MSYTFISRGFTTSFSRGGVMVTRILVPSGLMCTVKSPLFLAFSAEMRATFSMRLFGLKSSASYTFA